jgi:hypothetical protein
MVNGTISKTDVTEFGAMLAGEGYAYAQADHFAALAGMFGEGAVLIGRPEAPKQDPKQD